MKKISSAPQKGAREILGAISEPSRRELCIALLDNPATNDASGQPAWARRAALHVLRCMGLRPKGKSDAYCEGFFVGCALRSMQGMSWEEVGRKIDEPEVAASLRGVDVNKELWAAIGQGASQAPDVTTDFVNGWRDGQMIDPTKMNPDHTLPAYMLIVVCWREVASLRNANALHEWLVSNRAYPDAAKDAVNDSRTRKLIARIGLRYPDKGGRPKKKKPTPRLSHLRV